MRMRDAGRLVSRVRLQLLAAAWAWVLVAPGAVRADVLEIGYRVGAANGPLVLSGQEARQQVLATRRGSSLVEDDVTRDVRWSVIPEGVMRVDATGQIRPMADGVATLTATTGDGLRAQLAVRVERSAESTPVHFANQVVPVFTKNGCNGGGCHGKAAGQNGFRLSLLGFEPGEDYEHLVNEARGRRLFPAAPERSLLLTKGTAELPHGGGRRLEPGSEDHQLLVRWIRQGMPRGRETDPTVTRIEVFPSRRSLSREREQQLVVTAHYSDGRMEDVTRSALFESNEKNIAQPDEQGRVKVYDQPGEFAVMVRYQGKVATFRGTVPLGAPVDALPMARGFVDDEVFKQWRTVGMPPSEVADDATFLRRLTVDLASRLPTVGEIDALRRAASAEDAPSGVSAPAMPVTLTPARLAARDAAIERLLASAEYADTFANKWGALLRNKRSDARHSRGTYGFHAWIRDSFASNKPYDQFVREILTAAGDLSENPPVAWYRQVRTMQQQLEDISQLFLGQRLQCAQCHHHPYEKWSQADYWSFGAFFSQVSYRPGSQPGEETVVPKRALAQATNKKTERPVKPAGLGDPVHGLTADDDARFFLAEWMTRPDNRFFARALVNRYWKHFFGRGLVDPEDDMRETNPPTHPDLLEALAANFVRTGYDLRELARTLVRSTTYQLAAVPNAYNARDRQQFSRYYPRRLSAEVLHDSIGMLLGVPAKFEGMPAGTRAVCLPDNSFNAGSYFLTVFGRPESSSACECERSMEASLSQSLHLLNAKDLQERLAADGGRAARYAADTTRADAEKVREIYLAAYTRPPTADEERLALDHLARKTAAAADDAARAKARREAWEDTLWAVMNTKEFLFNH